MAERKYTLVRVGATATPAQGITLASQLRPFFVGATGPAGRSAYESAVAAGFVGTEAEWLASIAATAAAEAALSTNIDGGTPSSIYAGAP